MDEPDSIGSVSGNWFIVDICSSYSEALKIKNDINNNNYKYHFWSCEYNTLEQVDVYHFRVVDV